MVASGFRRLVGEFSLAGIRGEARMNSLNRCADGGGEDGDDERRDVFIDEASLFRHSLH